MSVKAQEQEHVHDTDTYYLDQLCMIGITAAFAGICLAMYFFNTTMLSVLLNAQFHIYILLVGIALSFIVLVRAAVLWKAAGAKPLACDHDHSHDHEHGADHQHDHGDCGHDHAHDCGHDHGNEHAQHAHNHDCGHDHSWAPWRYVVLLVPVMLFLLGLPNKEIPLRAADNVDVSIEPDSPEQNGAADQDYAVNIPFKTLEQLAYESKTRSEFDKKKVHAFGQFVPYRDSSQVFFLSRLRIQCCGADAVQLNIPVVSRQPLRKFNMQDWVGVTGRIQFREQPGRPGVYQTILVVNSKDDVFPTAPDSNPYIN